MGGGEGQWEGERASGRGRGPVGGGEGQWEGERASGRGRGPVGGGEGQWEGEGEGEGRADELLGRWREVG